MEDWSLAFDDTEGSGPAMLLCHALGADRTMWDRQAEEFALGRRIVRYDHRGHGQSDSPPGPYTIADLGGDVITLADVLGLDVFDFCGISMGGMVGMWLAASHPDRVRSLVLANTAPRIGTGEYWNERIARIEAGGIDSIGDVIVERFFSPEWRQTHDVETNRARKTLGAVDPDGYIGCCAAIRDADLSDSVTSIRARTMVIGGLYDVSTPPEAQEELAAAIPGSDLFVIDAGHFSNLEAPEEFNTALRRHLSD
jgi:3-oxoadipate enol-lactonase